MPTLRNPARTHSGQHSPALHCRPTLPPSSSNSLSRPDKQHLWLGPPLPLPVPSDSPTAPARAVQLRRPRRRHRRPRTRLGLVERAVARGGLRDVERTRRSASRQRPGGGAPGHSESTLGRPRRTGGQLRLTCMPLKYRVTVVDSDGLGVRFYPQPATDDKRALRCSASGSWISSGGDRFDRPALRSSNMRRARAPQPPPKVPSRLSLGFLSPFSRLSLAVLSPFSRRSS